MGSTFPIYHNFQTALSVHLLKSTVPVPSYARTMQPSMYGPPMQQMHGKHVVRLEMEGMGALRMPVTPAPRWLSQSELNKLANDINRRLQEVDGNMCCALCPCTAFCYVVKMHSRYADVEKDIRQICLLWSNQNRTAFLYKHSGYKGQPHYRVEITFRGASPAGQPRASCPPMSEQRKEL